MINQQIVINLAIEAGVIDSADIDSIHISQAYIDDLAHFADLVMQIESSNVKPEQEPVAWRIADERDWEYCTKPPLETDIQWSARYGRKYEPLYTAPPTRKPLTEEEIMSIAEDVANEKLIGPVPEYRVRFARAIERAHGIGGE